jgi:hypothetical protein
MWSYCEITAHIFFCILIIGNAGCVSDSSRNANLLFSLSQADGRPISSAHIELWGSSGLGRVVYYVGKSDSNGFVGLLDVPRRGYGVKITIDSDIYYTDPGIRAEWFDADRQVDLKAYLIWETSKKITAILEIKRVMTRLRLTDHPRQGSGGTDGLSRD